MLTQNQEWERACGSMTRSIGDMSVGSGLFERGAKLAFTRSKFDWDSTINQATVLLDDKFLLQGRQIF